MKNVVITRLLTFVSELENFSFSSSFNAFKMCSQGIYESNPSLARYLCNLLGPNGDPALGTGKKKTRTLRTEKGGRQETVHTSSGRILCSSKRHPGI